MSLPLRLERFEALLDFFRTRRVLLLLLALGVLLLTVAWIGGEVFDVPRDDNPLVYWGVQAAVVLVALIFIFRVRNTYVQYAIPLSLFACYQVFFLSAWLHHRVGLVESERIDRDVSKLGGPCMAVQSWEYEKLGSIGIGACSVRYTNAAQTAATVELQIFRRNAWAGATADTVTDGGPLASLKWRVIRSAETPWQVDADK